MPTVRTLYDPGTAQPLEDCVVEHAPFFAVFDGVSGLYHPGAGWRSFGGKSGGQRVIERAREEIEKAAPADSLQDVLQRINKSVEGFVKENGLVEPHDIPGTTFALAKVSESGTEVIQGGDAFAVWRYKDGSVGATANPNYQSETQLLSVVHALMEKHGGDKQAMWDEYFPVLKEAKKRANAPGGYVVLNGDKNGESLWARKSFAKGEIDLLLLVTDGLVALEETKDPEKMAHTLIDVYAQGGVEALLARVRIAEEGRSQHVKHAEASVVAMEFN